MEILDTNIRMLKGVGNQRAQALEKLGIRTFGDLLIHFPRSYIDLSQPYAILDAPTGEACAVMAQITRKSTEIRLRGGLNMYKATAEDESGSMELVFFNTRYTFDALEFDTPYLFYGRMEGNLLKRSMNSPAVYPSASDTPFIAVYPLTAGLTAKVIAGLVRQALEFLPAFPDNLPLKVRERYGLAEIAYAIQTIHCPSDLSGLEQARKRLMFEELFTLAVGVGLLKSRTCVCQASPMQAYSMQPFYDALPFSLTGAQQRAIAELTSDMQKPIPANRLVQGDVGSGKTMVAAAGAYFAFRSGAQSAIMAPTELLARQHYDGLSSLCGKLGMRTGLLTGSMTAAQKRTVREQLISGEIDLCIGTHALISDGVEFRNLALVITDEQHRFGVLQRTALQKKGSHAHTLVMSATPIPRTLALMVYGELDISVIDELPPNRQPVTTYKISSGKRERAFGFIRKHLDRGLQAYIVCPLVEQGEEDTGLRAAAEYMEELRDKHFTDYQVGLLHGKMKASEKEHAMASFKEGGIQLLVSTTVVEVGVDVPNAVIMMVENAERFGLSQLHQLRGRVGRGKEQSYCILLSDSRNEATLERLKMMCKTNNGFEIAEYDLKTRGPGNFLGQEQHGLPQLRIADLTSDIGLIEQAQNAAKELLAQDPLLSAPEHVSLKKAVDRLMHAVGERPN